MLEQAVGFASAVIPEATHTFARSRPPVFRPFQEIRPGNYKNATPGYFFQRMEPTRGCAKSQPGRHASILRFAGARPGVARVRGR